MSKRLLLLALAAVMMLPFGFTARSASAGEEITAEEYASMTFEDLIAKGNFADPEKLTPEECMYIGDDLVDAPPMQRCGLAVAVGDAVPELDRVANLRLKSPGGRGAVREAVEFLLKEQGKWSELLKRYLGPDC